MRNLLIAFLFLLIPSLGAAQSPGITLLTGTSQDGILVAFANEAITVAGTSIGFTEATINPTCTDCPLNVLRATRADCTTELQTGINIRVTITGTTPTSSVGILISSGQSFTVYGYTNIAAFRAIRTASTSVAMYCTYTRPN